MSQLKIYIYGNIQDYQKTESFLSNDKENIIHITSIIDFLKLAKQHDTYDRSAILNGGHATDAGFYEYYNILKLKENEIVFCEIMNANDIPVNGIFKNSYLIDNKINANFIMSNSHLLAELLQDGWAEFNNNIKDLSIDTYIDKNYPIYKINDNLYEKFKTEYSIYKQMTSISNDIANFQKHGIPNEIAEAAQRRLLQHSAARLEKAPTSETPIDIRNSPALGQLSQSHLFNSMSEKKIRQERIDSSDTSDYMKYYLKKYGK